MGFQSGYSAQVFLGCPQTFQVGAEILPFKRGRGRFPQRFIQFIYNQLAI
jgi:hypothetical protein